VTDEALRTVVADYTREAGVRSLERELGGLMRKVAGRVAGGGASDGRPTTGDRVTDRWWSTAATSARAGTARYEFESLDRTSVPGVATGLAVTGPAVTCSRSR